MITAGTIIYYILAFFALTILYGTVVIVPQRHAFIVERLGKYLDTFTWFTLFDPFH